MQKFNGQLINQFPNSINGNAAAGAQVTVRVKQTGALATLYATDSTTGATLANPIIADSRGYYGFFAADGVYTIDVNISGTPQLVIQLQDVAALKFQFDNAVSNAGYIPVGTFAAGCTIAQVNGVVSDGSAFWRWDGALPKTVTAGSAPTPVGVGGWIVLSDFALRGELADANSIVSVAGTAASSLSRSYKSVVYVRDFKTGGSTDDAAVQSAVDYAFRDGYSREIVFEGDLYLTQQIGIPQLTFYTTSVNKFTGVGSAKINLSGMPANTALFTSAERKANPTAVADLYTGNLLFSGLAFEGNRTSSVVFDGDALYNVEVTGCIFKDLFKVAASGYAKPGYPGGYFQSMFFHHNRFTNIGNGTNGGIIYGGSGFNVTFNDNFCEAGNQGYGIYMFGGASQAMRFQNNVYEGSSKFLYASNMQGVISGNYFEGNHYGVNTTSSGIEIELFDIAASAVASTVTIQDNVCFAYPTGFSALVKYTGIQENNLSIIGNQIRRTDAYIYYSTNSRPGFYKNNSNHINLVTDPDTANRCYTIEGGSYRKAFNAYLPAAGTRNVIVNMKGGGNLRVKVSAVISGRADGVSCEYAVIGGLFATNAPKIVEVFKSDTDSGDLIQLGTVVSAAGKVTFPITTSAGSGGKVFVEVVGLAFDGATDEIGMTATNPDVCKIEVTT